MKNRFPYFIWILLILVLAVTGCHRPEGEWTEKFAKDLAKLPNVVSVTQEEGSGFAAKFKVFFKQPIDHNNPSAGTFKQLVYVCLEHPDSLNVLITEGYYAFDANSRHELASMLNGNQIVVEHRYYVESTINDPNFRYNDAENSCDDLHVIVSELKRLLSRKWVSTGRSKSGLTSNMYRAYYPYDVDVTIPYGSPFCQSRYDERIAQALKTTIGTPEARAKITAFQREVLSRREVMAHKWDSTATAQGVQLRLPANKMLDLNIMDFKIGFWQFGCDVNTIPEPTASDKTIFNFLISIIGPDSWDPNYDVNKYYTEAYKELGHYALPTDGLEDLLVVDDYILQDFLKYTFVPDGVPNTYSTAMYQKVDAFLRQTDAKYIFIYGGWDPWCYVGIGPEYVRGNIHRYVFPTGSHNTGIAHFDPATQAEIKALLNQWLR